MVKHCDRVTDVFAYLMAVHVNFYKVLYTNWMMKVMFGIWYSTQAMDAMESLEAFSNSEVINLLGPTYLEH